MKQKSVVQSIRFSYSDMNKITWLRNKKINPATLIRNGFNNEFNKFINNYNKESKEKLPF
jgi:hypothetical protein